MREGSGLFFQHVGFSIHMLGRDRDMRRNVPMGAMLAPQPKTREKIFGRRKTASQKEKRICYIDISYDTFVDYFFLYLLLRLPQVMDLCQLHII